MHRCHAHMLRGRTRRNLTLVGQMAHAPCWPLARMRCGLGTCRSMHAIDRRTKMPCMSALWGLNEHSQGVPDERQKHANSVQRATCFSTGQHACGDPPTTLPRSTGALPVPKMPGLCLAAVAAALCALQVAGAHKKKMQIQYSGQLAFRHVDAPPPHP